MERIYIIITSQDAGERVDTFLTHKKVLPSRAQVQKLIKDAKIKVNGFPTKPSYRLEEADHIIIEPPKPEASFLKPQALPLDILYEDEHVIVIYKKAGEVVHPGAGHKEGTLVNALLAHGELSPIGGVLRPGVVHRLDKDTSGVIIFAKTELAHRELSEQFQKRTVKRKYYALVFGKMRYESGFFNETIGRHPVERKKMSTRSKKGKSALTSWKVLEGFDQMTFIEASLATGRTHQIRVHFSHAGHPVVGDKLYGGAKRLSGIVDMNVRRTIQPLSALLLHAAQLQFQHPVTKETLLFEVPLPNYFKEILNLLRNE